MAEKLSVLMKDKVFVIKWAASIMQIIGYTATGFGFTPWNAYLFILGLVGWFMVGVMWNDRADYADSCYRAGSIACRACE